MENVGPCGDTNSNTSRCDSVSNGDLHRTQIPAGHEALIRSPQRRPTCARGGAPRDAFRYCHRESLSARHACLDVVEMGALRVFSGVSGAEVVMGSGGLQTDRN